MEKTMFTKTKIALAVALAFSNVSVALADGEFDSNLEDRYPQAAHTQILQSRGVALAGAPQIHSEMGRASKNWGGGGY
jgi:hypothetical protein